jgi:hypothetical protein
MILDSYYFYLLALDNEDYALVPICPHVSQPARRVIAVRTGVAGYCCGNPHDWASKSGNRQAGRGKLADGLVVDRYWIETAKQPPERDM